MRQIVETLRPSRQEGELRAVSWVEKRSRRSCSRDAGGVEAARLEILLRTA